MGTSDWPKVGLVFILRVLDLKQSTGQFFPGLSDAANQFFMPCSWYDTLLFGCGIVHFV
jgi:hypothetical protein